MKDYTLVETGNGHEMWMKTANNDGPLNIAGKLKLGRELSVQRKELDALCHATLEEYEDEVAETIRSNRLMEDREVFSTLLCFELTSHCTGVLDTENAARPHEGDEL